MSFAVFVSGYPKGTGDNSAAKSRVTGASLGGRSSGESAHLTWPSRRHPWCHQARATRPAAAVAPSPPSRDLGAVGTEDWAAIDSALADGDRFLSAYLTDSGTKVWIITEWDRSATTVLLPEEY